MSNAKPEAVCPACRQWRPLKAFKEVLPGPPVRLLDFCDECVGTHGLQALYKTHTDGVDPEIRQLMLVDKQARKIDQAKAEAVRMDEAARKEMAQRELSRRMLLPFVMRFFPTYQPGWVHQDICRRLEQFVRDVEEKKSPRLILTVPPRHGKSTLVSDMFPSWVLGKHPEWELIASSYSLALPLKFSRDIRNRLRDPAYQGIFPETTLRNDAAAAEEWRLTAGGGYRAAGVGGGITGMGAHILLVDDPVKDAAEASSETIRENTKAWFNTAAYSRLAPGGGVLLVMTRWHDDDLVGHVLAQMREQIEAGMPEAEIDMWELINYPAIATADEYLMPDGSIQTDVPTAEIHTARLLRRAGQALHPDRYDLPKLTRIKNRFTPHEWSALFQQDPVPDDGAFFSRDMFKHYSFLPGSRAEYTYITAWDVAIGEKKRNDWTVGITAAINEAGDIFVVDMVRGRLGTMEIVHAVCNQVEQYDCEVVGMEHGAIKLTVWPLIVEEMRRRRLSCSINDDLKPITDKETRATPLRGLMQQGRVYFPTVAHRPWVEKIHHEMLRFPAGSHDDIVDAAAWLARMYRTAPRPQVSQLTEKQRTVSFREKLHEFPGALPAGDGGDSYMAY
jgi:predicted phage terminase large subunit-like protein